MKKVVIVLSLLLFSQMFTNGLFAFNKQSEKLASATGNEFWFSVPPCYQKDSNNTYDLIKIYIVSTFKTPITVEIPASGYLKTQYSIPNDVVEFDITPVQGQPYRKGVFEPNVPDNIFSGKGIHVFADNPILVYCIVQYQIASEGFLCLPVSSLGKEYIVAGQESDRMFLSIWNYKLPNITTITAPNDNTEVKFTLGGTPPSQTAGGLNPGESKTWILNKGDVLVISGGTIETSLSGSKITSTKPVCVVSGSMLANVPMDNQWANYLAEMERPTYMWGNVYIVPQIPNRNFSSFIRIIAKEENTTIYRNEIKIGTIKRAGGIENQGYLQMRMTQDNKPASVVISGDKPISVTLYNTGNQEDGYGAQSSKPFQMNILSANEFQNEIAFYEPTNNSDYISLVYEKDDNSSADSIMIACQVKGNNENWIDINNLSILYDDILSYKGKKYGIKGISLPGGGLYKIQSPVPMASYSYSLSNDFTFGYPSSSAYAGNFVAPNAYIIPDTLDFKKPDIGTKVTKTFKVFNRSFFQNYNLKDLILRYGDKGYSVNLSGQTLPVSIKPGYSAEFSVDFVATTDEMVVDDIGIGDSSSFDFKCHLIAGKMFPVIRTQDIDFGLLEPYTRKDTTINIKNSGRAPLKLYSVSEPQNSMFIFNNGISIFGDMILPDSSVSYPLSLILNSEADKLSDSFIFNSNSIGGDSIALISIKQNNKLAINVNSIGFNEIVPNMTTAGIVSINNTGNNNLKIYGIDQPSLSYFTTDFPLDVNKTNPVVVAPGKSFTMKVYFKAPSDYSKKFNDKIVFHSNAVSGDSIADITASTITDVYDQNELSSIQIKIDNSGNHLLILSNSKSETINKVVLYDISGNTLYTNENAVGASEISVDLSNFLSGLYLLKLTINNKILSSTFVVSK